MVKGIKQRNAKQYLRPANVRGGMWGREILTMTQDVDHKKVTNRAWMTLLKWVDWFGFLVDMSNLRV